MQIRRFFLIRNFNKYMEFFFYKASKTDLSVLENLMQFYKYDFSGCMSLDVEDNGLFAPYQELEKYLIEENRFCYLISVNKNYAGFALVKYETAESNDHYSIAEFFIMKKYRRAGIGRSVVKNIFDLHKGKWQIFQWEQNQPARLFWKNVIHEYTNGEFAEQQKNGKYYQTFEN